MATFKFEATIYVQDVETAQDAIDILQSALDEYESMTGRAAIIIHHEEPKLVTEE